MKKIILETPLISTNALYFSGGPRRLTPRARMIKDSIGWEARTQYHGEPKTGDLCVRIELHFKDKRRRDIDNIKALLDALSGILWDDDSQIIELHLFKYTGAAHPRVEISFI